MLRLVTLICLATTVLGTPLQGGERIVGGGNAVMKDFPYQLSLNISGLFECGAVIISPLWALTAAQCAGGTVANMKIRAGSNRYTILGTVHSVTQKVVHLSYNLATKDHDIALLKVDPPFEYVSGLQNIQPVKLPPQNSLEVPADETVTTVSGWGLTMAGGVMATTLQSVQVKIVNIDTCKSSLDPSTVTDQMLCAIDTGKDACQGDTGGPLVVKDPAAAKDDVLVGLVSWGRGCAVLRYPHVYTNIAAHRNWILANAGI